MEPDLTQPVTTVPIPFTLKARSIKYRKFLSPLFSCCDPIRTVSDFRSFNRFTIPSSVVLETSKIFADVNIESLTSSLISCVNCLSRPLVALSIFVIAIIPFSIPRSLIMERCSLV